MINLVVAYAIEINNCARTDTHEHKPIIIECFYREFKTSFVLSAMLLEEFENIILYPDHVIMVITSNVNRFLAWVTHRETNEIM